MLTAATLLFTLAQSPQPLTEFEQKFLAVQDEVTHSDDGSCDHGIAFTQGKYKRPLTAPEFLRAVGRVEQAEYYQTRRTLAGVLVGASLVTMAAGAFATMAEHAGSRRSCGPVDDPGFSQCVQQMVENFDQKAGMGTMWVTAGIAAALFGGGLAVYPSFPDPVEMRRLADEHNQALRLRLSVKGRF
jgi:hypothetical protein